MHFSLIFMIFNQSNAVDIFPSNKLVSCAVYIVMYLC